MDVRHDVQQRFGAQARGGVNERDDAGLELGAFQDQAPDQIGTSIAEESRPQHLDGAQPCPAARREHIVHAPRDELRIACRIAEGNGEICHLQHPLNEERVHGPGTGEVLGNRSDRWHDAVRTAKAVRDRLPLAVMHATLRRVQVGEREVRLVAAVNPGSIRRLDLAPQRLLLLQLREGTLQLLGERVDGRVVQPETTPRIGNRRRVVAALERLPGCPGEPQKLGVEVVEDAQNPLGRELHPCRLACRGADTCGEVGVARRLLNGCRASCLRELAHEELAAVRMWSALRSPGSAASRATRRRCCRSTGRRGTAWRRAMPRRCAA